jgi:4-hydroxy-3-polyprenylbenzoate decarboxylase
MQIIVGITGASGAIYAKRALELMTQAEVRVHLVVTKLGRQLLKDELDMSTIDCNQLTGGRASQVVLHGSSEMTASVASGSNPSDGMLIVPCSSNTLGAIASGMTNNLVQRAASVMLKERRRLVLAHRETPLSLIDLENMKRLTHAGAIIAPLSPGFYLRPTSHGDLVDFMVGRLLDLLNVPHTLNSRWDRKRSRDNEERERYD